MAQQIQFKVTNRKQQTPDSHTIYLKPIGLEVDYLAGQFLTFIFDHFPEGEVRRSYSLSSAPDIDEQLAITLKRVSNGLVSSYLINDTKVGDTLTALTPAGQFTFSPQSKTKRDIFLIGGGSGVTPLFSILKTALHFEPQSRVILIDANRNAERTIFYKDLQAFAKRFNASLQIIHLWSALHITEKIDLSKTPNIKILPRRFSNDLLEQLIVNYKKAPKHNHIFYLCGPTGLMIKAQTTLGYLGYKELQIKKEIFVIKTKPKPTKAFTPSKIKIQYKQSIYEFKTRPDETILEAAHRNNIILPYSCKSGICTTCTGTCLSGKVEMYTQEGIIDTDDSKGVVLSCVGYPLTKVVEIRMG